MRPMEMRRRALALDAKAWLYRSGSEFPSRTAGWADTLGSDGNTGRYYARDSYMELQNASTANFDNARRVGVVTQKAISLSGYTKLCMEFSANTTSGRAALRLALYTSADRRLTAYSHATAALRADAVDTRQRAELDLSELQDRTLFVGAVWVLDGGVNLNASAYIHSIWLE